MVRGAKAGLLVSLWLFSGDAGACETCRPTVKAGVYNAGFAPTLGLLLLPLGVIAAVAVGIYRSEER